jgi:hypothetical protein
MQGYVSDHFRQIERKEAKALSSCNHSLAKKLHSALSRAATIKDLFGL